MSSVYSNIILKRRAKEAGFMVKSHEDYPTGISKVILSPTSMFPEGKNFFYVDTEDLDLVYGLKNCKFYGDWNTHAYPAGARLYRAIIERHTKLVPDIVDHINGVSIDNTSRNLKSVTKLQNRRNRPWRGYKLCHGGGFVFCSTLSEDSLEASYCKTFEREDEVVLSRMEFESKYWTDYGYDFLSDRRGELDIISMEYEGKLSHEEATLMHVMRRAKNNAWYVLRYNLSGYFKEHGIPEPGYCLNESNRMCDLEKGILLCPLAKEGNFYGDRVSCL